MMMGVGMLTLKERLHDAAVCGNMNELEQILLEDPFILRRIEVGCLNHTPLHAAAFHGHLDIVGRILAENGALASVLDSRGWSPLHLASVQGHLQVVEKLLEHDDYMCMSRDGSEGKTPLHYASLRGHVEVLQRLIESSPFSQYGLLSAKDNQGNTILHLAVQHRQFETVRALLNVTRGWGKRNMASKVVNIANAIEYTALDLVHEYYSEYSTHREIMDLLTEAGSLTEEEVRNREDQLRRSDSLMVVVSLLAAMAFQVAMNPPGGFWQETENGHVAGESVWAGAGGSYNNAYVMFLVFNWLGFLVSVVVLLALAYGSPVGRSVYWMVQFSWVSVSLTYGFAIRFVSPIVYPVDNIFRVSSALLLLWWIISIPSIQKKIRACLRN